MSAFFGVLSSVSLAGTVYLTFLNRGETFVKYGVVALLCLIFSAVGLVLGLMARAEEDRFHLFAWIGLILNVLTLAGIGLILYAGVYGI